MFPSQLGKLLLSSAALWAITSASSLGLEDTGTAAGCTGSSGCCIPSCLVNVSDFYGCNGNVAFAGTCQQNYDNPSGTQDIGNDGCGDVQVTFLKDPSGNPAIDLYHKTDKKYDRYSFGNCQAPTTGGGQCVPKGGGCDTTIILTGAQG
ncbi:hypothetical protein FHETE_11285 [Fusarium heterosporum]|uniref:Uncharacterized protein n=1 Tax=Fusarium heterosporum TaxID=42747 RepID=A0A8H5SMT6_FUSHE|nr:hypothetical protein FHETE_11285 [Fusarium heterosporum]